MNLFHAFQQGDPVLITTFLLLIAMSITSWYLIFWKMWKLNAEKQNLAQFSKHTHDGWKAMERAQATGCVGYLVTEAKRAYAYSNANKSFDSAKTSERILTQALDKVKVWMDNGLTILASIGSSAPFVGLFGTVWGIYGALIDISSKGQASLNIVAGPMGEALVATAAGLFAAIPAVLAYNAFIRINRVYMQDLRHLAENIGAEIENQLKGDSKKAAPLSSIRGAI